MRLKPGGLRELHWHANAAEWAFVIKGRVRTTVIGPDGVSETNDFDPGDVWYFPRGHGHALQGLGPEEATSSWSSTTAPSPSTAPSASPTGWRTRRPRCWRKTLGICRGRAFAKFPREELYIVQGRVPPERRPPHQGASKSSPLTHRYPLMAQQPHGTFPRRRGAARQRQGVPDLEDDHRRRSST